MSWHGPVPDGVSGFRQTSSGFEAAVSILLDEEGFFGRECPSCSRFFKLREDQWLALPDEVTTTCPYCGHQSADPSDFATQQQMQRAESAALALAEQYMHDAINKAFGGLGQSTRSRGSGFGFEIKYTPGPRPPMGSLASYVEEEVRRTITCDNCQTIYAVYGATAFCPICGPRAAVDKVLESIERGRRTLALEDAMPQDLREQARADGMFDKAAADQLAETVTLFEVLAREQFRERVADHAEIVRKAGRGVFQRLDDTDTLFAEHVGTSLSSLVPPEAWSRLRVVFQQRHVLVHRQGIVDQAYLENVPTATQTEGQRLVITRREAEDALDALEAVVRAVGSL